MSKFKIGDKVKIVANSNSSWNKIGDIGVITERSSYNHPTWRVQVPGGPKTFIWTKETDMVLLEDFKYEDKWHLNDGVVEIPEDADTLTHNGSVVAFRKLKEKPIEVGCKVKSNPCSGGIGEVIAIHGDKLWVSVEGNSPMTYRKDTFKRID